MDARQFVIGFHGGWGARLAMLGAAFSFADRHARQLRVYWDHGFPCSWSVSTSTQIAQVSGTDWRALKFAHPAVARWQVGDKCWTHAAGMSDVSLLALSATEIPPEICTFEAAVAIVKDRVSFAAAQPYPLPVVCVGVHVRRTDHALATARSPLTLFTAAMRTYPGDTVFFLCSDDPLVRVDLLREFPGRIVEVPQGEGRRTEAGLVHDLRVLRTLSCCTEIIGSYGSSFSRFAACFGAVPLRIVDSECPEV